MRLLLDANVSPQLVWMLADIFPGSRHVFDVGDIASDDALIWAYAKQHDVVIVSKDTDFLEMSLLYGPPPKVILLRSGNVPTARIERSLRKHLKDIERFLADANESYLIVGP